MKKATILQPLFSILVMMAGFLKAQPWTPQAFGNLDWDGIYAISIADSNTIWASASDEWSLAIGGAPGGLDGITILKTVDGGQAWETYFLADADTTWGGGTIGIMSFDLFAFDQDTAFLTTNDYGYRMALYKTTNGGVDWHKIYEDQSAGVWVRFFNRNEGVVIGGIYSNFEPNIHTGPLVSRTQDGGNTWERIKMPASATFIQDNYESLHGACQVLDQTIWFLTADATLFRSRDKGQTWESFEVGEQADIEASSIAFTDTLNGLALLATYNWVTNARGNHYYRTADGGATWNEIFPDDPNLHLKTIVPVPGMQHIILGYRKNQTSGSAYTTDYGQTWTTIEEQNRYSCATFLSPTVGWAANFNNYDGYGLSTPAMYKWEGDFNTVSSTRFEALPPCEIYPNPFTDRITLTSPVSMDQYSLYTIEGRLVQSGELGASDATLDLAAYGSAIFLLEITYGDGHKSLHKIIRGY